MDGVGGATGLGAKCTLSGIFGRGPGGLEPNVGNFHRHQSRVFTLTLSDLRQSNV